MLNEYIYCPRLFYLEWVQGEWADSADTVEGKYVHRRVDKESGSLLNENKEDGGPDFRATSVYLSAPKIGLTSRMDLVEGKGKVVYPVDYKKGNVPDIPDNIWDPEKVQLCAQGLILRENGYTCEQGMIWYAGSRQRVYLVFDQSLIDKTLAAIQEARALVAQNKIPEPLESSPKCPKCSLVEICLPDEIVFFQKRKDQDDTQGLRRLVAARQDRLPLFLDEQGTKLGLKGECLEIKNSIKKLDEIRIKDVSSLSVRGNVQISTQAIRELCSRNIPIAWFSYGGWFYGFLRGLDHKNILLRKQQFSTAIDEERCLKAAASFVQGKIMNCRTMLRRNHAEPDKNVLQTMRNFADKTHASDSLSSLLGLEGSAAGLYFANFNGMLKHDEWKFSFQDRNRRPPRDPVNCLLSYGYAMLTKDFTITAATIGFDPYLGFYHQPKYGRPALALDFMEEFRPLIVDSVVLTCLNSEIIRKDDFIYRNNGVSMKPGARKRFIQAYSRRMDALVTHPVFKYRISYRQVIEVQARLFGRFLQNEIDTYPCFMTR
jgi:CRISPR-associated endonuclease Cas1/CRISPR-associated protein Cas4